MDSCKFSGKEALAASYNIAIERDLQYKKRQSILWYWCSFRMIVLCRFSFAVFDILFQASAEPIDQE